MGLFLAMSGVANASRAAVEEALRAYATERGGTWNRLTHSPTRPTLC